MSPPSPVRRSHVPGYENWLAARRGYRRPVRANTMGYKQFGLVGPPVRRADPCRPQPVGTAGPSAATDSADLVTEANPPIEPAAPTGAVTAELPGRVVSYRWPGRSGPPAHLLRPLEPPAPPDLPQQPVPPTHPDQLPKPCSWCGAPLPAWPRRRGGRLAQFCSVRCRVAAHRHRHSPNRRRLVINKRCPLRPMNRPVRPLPWTGTSLTAAAPPCPRDPTVHAAASGTLDAERPTFAVVARPRNAGRTPAAPLRTPDRVLIATAQERSRQTVRPADWPAQIGCADPAGRTGIGCLHQLFLASRHRHLNLVRLCQNVELCSRITVHRLEVFPKAPERRV